MEQNSLGAWQQDLSPELAEEFVSLIGDFPFQAVIFDCDGTLAATADLHFSAFSAALANQHAELSREWYSRQTGLGRDGLFEAYIRDFGGDFDQPRLVKESIGNFCKIAWQARPIIPVVEFARSLAGKMPLAVGSNGERVAVVKTLEALGIDGLFSAVVGVDDVPNPKPAPDIYLRAASLINVSPSVCLVLEDTDEGLSAAKNAGAYGIDVRGL